jgi:hypothetical protein
MVNQEVSEEAVIELKKLIGPAEEGSSKKRNQKEVSV